MEEFKIRPVSDEIAYWAGPGLEHAELELIEARSGHFWERTASGDIKLIGLDRRCKGLICRSCGFSFCMSCLDLEGTRLSTYEPSKCTNSFAEHFMFEQQSSIRLGHLVLRD
jgi:hypothetical protein